MSLLEHLKSGEAQHPDPRYMPGGIWDPAVMAMTKLESPKPVKAKVVRKAKAVPRPRGRVHPTPSTSREVHGYEWGQVVIFDRKKLPPPRLVSTERMTVRFFNPVGPKAPSAGMAAVEELSRSREASNESAE